MTERARPVAGRPAWFLPGVWMAVLLSALVLLAGVLILRGLAPVSPGHARVVQGAAGMVRMARPPLEGEGVVQLDEERKAAMVSDLLVVLCGEQATEQVPNTDSLH